ncbi:GNAT family N-acetyltransferase [Peribacillus sp. NPDC060253]|uniref:GNAT family N-acetyltransferase n=1 Tax=Peribacillus sp. NPDC060253 TaxID=3347084 RepID=UPI0036501FAC
MSKMHQMKSIAIRALESNEELENVRRLESIIWSEYESTPTHQTLTAIKNGGIVLGAFLDGELIGFQYSFPGFDGNKSYLCSHILGIHPNFRKLGIGEKLKLQQREESIKKGYDLITWTFDPLETVNGYLNFHKLGARSSTYVENCYGEMLDVLNHGMPSDRFIVQWWIKDKKIESENLEIEDRLREDSLLIKALVNPDGYLAPMEIDLTRHLETGLLFVPMPSDFQKLKQYSSDLALSWRMNTRHVFTHYFKKGWIVIDLIRRQSDSDICFYVFKKSTKSLS